MKYSTFLIGFLVTKNKFMNTAQSIQIYFISNASFEWPLTPDERTGFCFRNSCPSFWTPGRNESWLKNLFHFSFESQNREEPEEKFLLRRCCTYHDAPVFIKIVSFLRMMTSQTEAGCWRWLGSALRNNDLFFRREIGSPNGWRWRKRWMFWRAGSETFKWERKIYSFAISIIGNDSSKLCNR